MDGMLNIPVLTLDNALTFGRLFTGGYKNARGITRARIKATKEAERAAKKAGRTAQKSQKEQLIELMKKEDWIN